MKQLTPQTLKTIEPEGIYELAVYNSAQEHPTVSILPDYVQGAYQAQDVERVVKATAAYFNQEAGIMFRRIA
jgi:hypothetical protein